MSKIILVTGGARSGKSLFAESFYKDCYDVTYIATMQDCDDETKERINKHKAQRPKQWATFEGYYDLERAVSTNKNYLLECITVMISNIMFDYSKNEKKISPELQDEIEGRIVSEISKLVKKIRSQGANLVMVTNEVGDSIVPENHIARVFRDINGRINRKTAEICDEVYLVCCGISLKLK